MKRKVIITFASLSVAVALAGCAANTATLKFSEAALAEVVVEEPTNENQEIIDDLKQVRDIVNNEHDTMKTAMDSIEDMYSSVDVFDGLVKQFTEDAKTLNSVARTGNDSIDKTYDAAIYYNTELTEIVTSYRDIMKTLVNLLDAIEPVKDFDSSKYATEEQQAEAMYRALSNFYDKMKKAQYPSYCQSRMEIFMRKIQYFQTSVYEAYQGVVNDDPLRACAASNISDRVGIEFSTSTEQLLESFDVQVKAEKAAAEELNLVYDEIIANTDIILNVLEGGE